jgi:beta-phosphoglucomutase-like phosphatase (HAD superfamily)
VALWHIAKAALVRDFAERVLRGEVPVNEPTPDSFSHWVASRLLSPDELARYEAEVSELDD